MMSELNNLLKDINHILQFDYNIRDRYDRVFYTASLLVGLSEKDYDVSAMDTPDVSRVRQLFKNERQKDYGVTDDVKKNLTDKIDQLYDFANSDSWQGIDLMGMMSSQFVSNKGKSDNGQVFTPHHISQLMADVIDMIVKTRDEKAETAKIIKPDLKNLENLSWPVPLKPFEISSSDFMKTIMDYEMFKQGVDVKKLRERIADAVLYDSEIAELNNKILIELPLKTYKKTFEENRKLQEERKMFNE